MHLGRRGGGGDLVGKGASQHPAVRREERGAELGDTLRPLSHLLSDLIGFSATLLPVGFFFLIPVENLAKVEDVIAGRGGGGA